MTNPLPILIIGGGIGGMTLALALAQKNISSLVLEQAPFIREAGYGIQLASNVFRMFDYLGIIKPMMEIAAFPESQSYVDGLSGFEFLRIPMGQEINARFKYPCGAFQRQELMMVLNNECQKYTLIKLVTSAKVIEVKKKNNKVLAKTDNDVIYEGEALVGCDGLWSVVRNFIKGKEPPRNSGRVSYRGLVTLDKVPEHLRPHKVIHWDRPDAILVQYPIGTKGLLNIVAFYNRTPPYKTEETIGNPEELYKKFEGSRPELLEILSYVDSSRKWVICDREPISEWSEGCITLLGDAAHPTLPHYSQGAAMAIEDAVVLAHKVNAFNRDYTAAFKAYQKERYLRTAYVQLFSRMYGDAHFASGIARELKLHLMPKRSVQENYDWLAELYNGIEVS